MHPPPPSAGTAPPSGGNPNPFPPMPTKKDTRAAATALRDRTNGAAAAPKPAARPVVQLEIPDDDDLDPIAAIDVDAAVQRRRTNNPPASTAPAPPASTTARTGAAPRPRRRRPPNTRAAPPRGRRARREPRRWTGPGWTGGASTAARCVTACG